MINLRKSTWLKHAGAGILAASCAGASEPASAASLMDGINGSWSGHGRVTFDGGRSEDLSCRAYYATSGTQLSLAIRCASPSYKAELRSKLHVSNGSLAGSWEERNFNAAGSASGSLSGNTIALRIDGAITGRLTLEQAGARQSVSISTNGGGLSSVKISLAKS